MRPAAQAVAVAVWIVALFMALDSVPRWWINRSGDPLDKAGLVLRMDARWGWRQREYWRGTFLGLPLETNEIGLREKALDRVRAADRRVLILGPSSTFGWGVTEPVVYARLLERALARRTPGSVAVVNGGEIGYSAWQGARFYEESGLRQLKPQVLLVAYGANDVDRFRFFFGQGGSDDAALGPGRSPGIVALANALRRVPLLALASRHAARWACGRSFASAGARAAASAPLRVPPELFRTALVRLVRQARGDGAAVVLATTASRYADLAVEGALRAETQRLARDLKRYNDLVRDVAKREGAAVADLEPLARRPDAASLFVDPIHFSPRGHAAVAHIMLGAMPPWTKSR